LLCFDQRRIFGLRLVPSGSRLEKADCRRAAVASMRYLGVGLATYTACPGPARSG
jgi:hypothetical protein